MGARAAASGTPHHPRMGRAILVVDVQNDFCEGGSLPVPGGSEVARPLSRLVHAVAAAGGSVFASRDWHPAKTHHFREWGGRWEPHCVQGTWGAAFHPDLDLPKGAIVVSKGMDPKAEGYSAFEAVDDSGEPLGGCLDDRGVHQLYIGGLTTDHCVLESGMDARMRGMRVSILVDAVRAIDPDEGARALHELETAGARLVTVAEALREFEGEPLSGGGPATSNASKHHSNPMEANHP
ncbi:MAG TPA: isochorismatase family protein [Vulgatibacter sp.]